VDDLIEIRYAGMVVAKSASIRDRDAAGFFIAVNEPMPVGTYVSLKINDQPKDEQPKHARVDQVVESTDATLAGMRLRFVDSVPARAPAPVSARPVPLAPVEAPPVAPAAAAPVAEVAPADDETGVTETEGGGGEVAGGVAGEASSASAGASGGGRRRRRRR
jgi:hypothetical protein